MLTLQQLARALGGNVSGRRVMCPGPGHSRTDRSLCVTLSANAPEGFITHSFAGDDWRECRNHVRQKLDLPDWQPGDGQRRTIDPINLAAWDVSTINKEAEVRPRTEEALERIARAQRLWNEAGDPRGTAAEHYLAARALTLHDDLAGSVLRFHPKTPWRNEDTGCTEFIPCLLAAFTSLDDNEVTAVHRIRVDQPTRWPKTTRRMMGLVHRAAIKLAPAGDELLIAEGLETAMSPRERGMTVPSWALGSVGAISTFPVIDGVKKLLIAGEPGNANKQAIQMCRPRWRNAGLVVRVLEAKGGGDLNDEVMLRKANG